MEQEGGSGTSNRRFQPVFSSPDSRTGRLNPSTIHAGHHPAVHEAQMNVYPGMAIRYSDARTTFDGVVTKTTSANIEVEGAGSRIWNIPWALSGNVTSLSGQEMSAVHSAVGDSRRQHEDSLPDWPLVGRTVECRAAGKPPVTGVVTRINEKTFSISDMNGRQWGRIGRSCPWQYV